MSNIKINIDNYEEFALDFLENNLSPEMQKSFAFFLEFHPEIAEEMNSLLEYQVNRPVLTYTEKEELKHKTNFFINPSFRILSVAATILLIAAILFLIGRSDSDNQGPSIAEENSTLLDMPSNVEHTERKVINPADGHENLDITEITNQAINERPSSDHVKSTPSTMSKSDTEIASDFENKIMEKPHPKKKNNNIAQATESNASNLAHVTKKNVTAKNNSTSTPANEKTSDQEEAVIAAEANLKSEKYIVNNDQQVHDIIVVENKMDKGEKNLVVQLSPVEISGHPIVVSQGTSSTSAEELSKRIPQLTVVVADETEEEIIIASNDEPEPRKRKFRLRDLIPEQLASLTGDDIKESLLPEAITSR